jgi:hypothetical protein
MVPLGVMWIKLRLDQLSARCDAFNELVEDTADQAIEYWLLGENPAPDETTDDGKKAAKEFEGSALKHEIKLRAAQIRLQSEFSRLVKDLPETSRDPLRIEFRDMINALTGGRFGDRDGRPESHKAQAAATAAAGVIRYVRQGRDDSSTISNLMKRWVSRH